MLFVDERKATVWS